MVASPPDLNQAETKSEEEDYGDNHYDDDDEDDDMEEVRVEEEELKNLRLESSGTAHLADRKQEIKRGKKTYYRYLTEIFFIYIKNGLATC